MVCVWRLARQVPALAHGVAPISGFERHTAWNKLHEDRALTETIDNMNWDEISNDYTYKYPASMALDGINVLQGQGF